MRSWLASLVVVGVALFVFVVAVLGVFDASIVALLVVMTVILVNNASRPKTTVKQ
jgi:hypothetical protein